jgi:hypothetical protein
MTTTPDQQLTVPDALDRLAELGNAVDIAVYLAGRGHVGETATDCCPVALYVRAETGTAVEVDPYEGDGWVTVEGHVDEYPLPTPVHDFALGFDVGRFPGLLAPETPA